MLADDLLDLGQRDVLSRDLEHFRAATLKIKEAVVVGDGTITGCEPDKSVLAAFDNAGVGRLGIVEIPSEKGRSEIAAHLDLPDITSIGEVGGLLLDPGLGIQQATVPIGTTIHEIGLHIGSALYF